MRNNASRLRLTGVLNFSKSAFWGVLAFLIVCSFCLLGLLLLSASWSSSVLEDAWADIKRWFIRSCVD